MLLSAHSLLYAMRRPERKKIDTVDLVLKMNRLSASLIIEEKMGELRER